MPENLRTSDLISLAGVQHPLETVQKYTGKRYGDLKDHEKYEFLLSLASSSGRKIYLLDNYIFGLRDPSKIMEMVEDLRGEGVLILDFVSFNTTPFDTDQWYITHTRPTSYFTEELGKSK